MRRSYVGTFSNEAHEMGSAA
ncbi:hypothetical protein AGR6A_Lc150153 [Agrobacterium sp. NCPPB 925]|nr:hypothetical protein AGR6A_Lc150153 [Agrobacterium sp. NCPPB 925]